MDKLIFLTWLVSRLQTPIHWLTGPPSSQVLRFNSERPPAWMLPALCRRRYWIPPLRVHMPKKRLGVPPGSLILLLDFYLTNYTIVPLRGHWRSA